MASQVNPPLLKFEKNVRSQSGEDGIIEHVLNTLPAINKWCVEFGAWDGIYCSNTNELIVNRGFSAVLIEANPKKCEDLRKTFQGNAAVHPVCCYIDFEGPNTLDKVLARTPIPSDFDVLSIDIDGCDYHIWDSLKQYRPKVVVIEYNPSIPNSVEFVPEKNMRIAQGCSLESLEKLGRAKNYRLVHATFLNAVFVAQEYFPLFGFEYDNAAELRADTSHVTVIFQTYDGVIHIQGNRRMLWHDVPMSVGKMQVIPRCLQTYVSHFSLLQRVCFKAYKIWLKFIGLICGAK